MTRRVSRRRWNGIEVGKVVRAARRKLRVHALATRVAHRPDAVEHITEVFTRSLPRRRASNVVHMPTADSSVIRQFLRYHVLVSVFDGDPDAWLAQLRARGRSNDGDLHFIHSVRSRMRHDPTLLPSIRAMVNATPFWHAAEA